jgi:dynactin 1
MQAAKRELEELRIKVRQLEQRKTEDQERIKGLESKAVELDTMRTARVKLQGGEFRFKVHLAQTDDTAKFQEIQSSLLSAQRQAKDYASENTHLETRATDAMEQLEMAALDREMAEEKAEAAEGEVEKLNEKVAELELEVALLKEENGQLPVSAALEVRSSTS